MLINEVNHRLVSYMAKETVLIIEDDPDISELVQYNLERSGYRVYCAEDGVLGLDEIKRINPDLLVLDLMLPGIGGMDICKKLRSNKETQFLPIIMLTAKGEESDVIVGLEMGADDYVTKPFSPKQLVARVQAVLRRTQMTDAIEKKDTLIAGVIKIDNARHQVTADGNPISLTATEFKLLNALAAKPGFVFTRDQLITHVSGEDTFVVDRNIDVHIRSIRKKLGNHSDHIQTVRGIGYKCLE